MAVTQEEGGAPLTAIDLLRGQTPTPVTPPSATPGPRLPTAQSGLPPVISAAPLGVAIPPAGLLPSAATGLPTDLWQGMDAAQMTSALGRLPTDLPAPLAALRREVLVTEAVPPVTMAPDDFHAIRLRELLRIGRAEDAAAMGLALPAPGPKTLAATFDAALHVGDEDKACATFGTAALSAQPPRTRIFCMARAGEWTAAALTLRTSAALGELTGAEEEVLIQFLDPELAGDLPPLPPQLDALEVTLRTAIGYPPSAARVPLAAAHRQLSDNAGWKAQLDAAERLARAQAIDPARLLALYRDGQPAASGAVWRRAALAQAVADSLAAGSADAAARALAEAYSVFEGAGLLDWLAAAFAEPLTSAPLAPLAEPVRSALLLRSARYEAARPAPGLSPALFEVAVGDPPSDPSTSLETIIGEGFAVAERQTGDVALGPAIVAAMRDVNTARSGDLSTLARGLATLRGLGLESTARRAALTLMLDNRTP
ncbi:MAG: hypothetical protein ACU0DW_04520 [Shimia sp.]